MVAALVTIAMPSLSFVQTGLSQDVVAQGPTHMANHHA